MTPEQFGHVEHLFHAVREASGEERSALLARADADLRREVESLLARQADALLLDQSVVEASTHLLLDADSPAEAGTLLGPYRIEGTLGEGGMGEVFRGIDTRLGRAVAIKIAHDRFSARVDREARAIASLNHPNICTLYDVGPNYLVMELVEGETLSARLSRGALPEALALEYAAQILAALAHAHAGGVIHRDLKPRNVMLGRTGAKVLDFGIATVAGDATVTGERIVMGTPAYMAPEQRAGHAPDPRSDIYSFGCVLGEMLAWSRPPQRRERRASPALGAIVTRCLDDDPARRWQTVEQLWQELSSIVPARRRRRFAVGIRRTMALMDRPPDARLTPSLALDVCVRTASTAVLDGSIERLGTQYVIGVRARNCTNGDGLADEQVQAARQEDVLAALSELAKRFRTRVGESLAMVEQYATPLEEATTPSLDAREGVSTASRVFMSAGGAAPAQRLFERAVALDPTFAMAHARLGINYSVLGETTLARQSTLTAHQLRDRASDVERFYIDTLYDRQVTGNLEREQRTLESWAQAYPRDPIPHGLLSGFMTRSTGNYQLSIDAARRAIALDPDGAQAPAYGSKAMSELFLNRLADAAATVEQAMQERKLEFSEFDLVRYFLAFLAGDDDAIGRTAALARSKRAAADMMSHLEALALARSGRLRDAGRVASVAIDSAKQSGQRERAALFTVATAVSHALYGRSDAARAAASAALALARGRDVDYAAALALAWAGDVARARGLAADLDKAFPEDTSVQSMYLPTLRALFFLAEGDAAAALEALDTTSRFDLALSGIGFNGYFGAMYPTYVRGHAYLAAHQPSRAAAQFQRIVDHRSIVLVDPMGALARLQLARALAQSGDVASSGRAYEDVLALWKDADPRSPAIDAAHVEYARLPAAPAR
jgi:tetratricopeptide (TPR) repeat protein/predicted Ser/Thr protein kinase